MQQYSLVTSDNLEEFVDKCNELTAQDWRAEGGVAIAYAGRWYYAQAFVRPHPFGVGT